MGAIHFSIDLELIKTLKRQLPLPWFVETGTFRGETTASVAPLFRKIHTVELSPEIYSETEKRLQDFQNISMIQGNSPNVLAVDFHPKVTH